MSQQPTKNRSKDLCNVRLLLDKDLEDLFGVSKSCLYHWRKKKILPYIKMGSTNFYLEDVILKMLYLRGGRFKEDNDDLE